MCRVRQELASAAALQPATTVGRAALGVLQAIGRRFRALGDLELHVACSRCSKRGVCCWARALDLGTSADTLRRALAMAAGATCLLERIPGRRLRYRCRAGQALRAGCRGEVDMFTASRAAEPEVGGGWEHPDLLLVAPNTVLRRRQLGEAREEGAGVAADREACSPRMAAWLRSLGVVRPELFTRKAARVMAAALRARPWLLRKRRAEAGIAAGEQHRDDYSARVAACPDLARWAEDDAADARRRAVHSRAARRLEVYRLRCAHGLALDRPSLLVTRASPEADPKPATSRPRARNGQFGERYAQDELVKHVRTELPRLRAEMKRLTAMDQRAVGHDTPYMRALARPQEEAA
jgi:hypothetical protein